jgi:pyrroloquinoline quinone biosynthesis protein B
MKRLKNGCVFLTGLLALLFFNSCKETAVKESVKVKELPSGVQLIILGTVQDAGSPQIGCEKECCAGLFSNPDPSRKIVSLGLIDSRNQKRYLFEATPDIETQLHSLNLAAGVPTGKMPDGIFLTHAHIGHYTGLMSLGKEAVNASGIPVFAMPRMKEFLRSNGPWSQLVSQNNINLMELMPDSLLVLTPGISVKPIKVPHRDEYSETVGFEIRGPEKKVLFIPDIDKWDRWELSIEEKIAEVDYAFLDATFYSGTEMDMRDISEIPHPFVIESMARFRSLPPLERQKIRFIHFNHTNPLLSGAEQARDTVISEGYHIAQYLEKFDL